MLLGFAFLILGIVGIVLPILPTTPFLLLTGYFLAKSSERLNNWFINTKLYVKYLKDFAEEKSMKRNQKWILLITVDVMMVISFFSVSLLFLKILIVVVEIFKYYYFTFHIKTI